MQPGLKGDFENSQSLWWWLPDIVSTIAPLLGPHTGHNGHRPKTWCSPEPPVSVEAACSSSRVLRLPPKALQGCCCCYCCCRSFRKISTWRLLLYWTFERENKRKTRDSRYDSCSSVGLLRLPPKVVQGWCCCYCYCCCRIFVKIKTYSVGRLL